MRKHKVSLNGTDALIKKLKQNATLEDVKTIVKVNTSELQRKMIKDAPVDTGFLKRSIVFSLASAGLTGRILIYAEYAPYLIFGTRFMANQDFVRPNFKTQSRKFKSDLERLVE